MLSQTRSRPSGQSSNETSWTLYTPLVIPLVIWFFLLTPAITLASSLVYYLYVIVFQRFLLHPSQLLIHQFQNTAQLLSETLPLYIQHGNPSMRLLQLSNLCFDITNSKIFDITVAVALDHISSKASEIRGVLRLRLSRWLIVALFAVPTIFYKVIFTIFGSMFILGGGGLAVSIYYAIILALDNTTGARWRDDQDTRLKENNSIYETSLTPLQVRTIQLLPGSLSDPVCCKIDTQNLAGAHFEALSYVWGSATLDRSIVINGRKVWITHNLYYALRDLRHTTMPRALWVDALCINQLDIPEREVQVSQMNAIYESAASVVVWLGVEPFGLSGLMAAFQREIQGPQGDYLAQPRWLSIQAVRKILRAPWWTRVWVVQELLMARRVMVHCGRQGMEWRVFCDWIDHVVASPRFFADDTYLEEYRAYQSLLSGGPSAWTGPNGLWRLLYDFRAKQATDPRDKLFAFLGILNTGSGQKGSPDGLQIRANYEADSMEVFRDCAIEMIRTSRSLAVLTLAECHADAIWGEPQSSNSQHSWFPQWSGRGNHFRARPFRSPHGNDGENEAHPRLAHFSASGGIPSPPCTLFGTSIRLTGWEADRVVAVGLPTSVTSRYLLNLAMDHKGKPPQLQELLRIKQDWQVALTYWALLATRHGITINDFANAVMAGRPWLQSLSLDGHKRYFPSGSLVDVANTLINFESEAIHETCHGRRFFVTAKGRCGLGPINTEEGNRICILLGADVPFVLADTRKASETYTGAEEPYESLAGEEVEPYRNLGQAFVADLMVYKGDLQHDIDTGRQMVDYIFLI